MLLITSLLTLLFAVASLIIKDDDLNWLALSLSTLCAGLTYGQMIA